MSGPWDRPSQDRDAEWPSEDLDSSGSGEPAAPDRDAWSSGDLWPEPSREAAQAWDDWPSTAPPDDPTLDVPEPALSDPWAESWSDDSVAPAGYTDRADLAGYTEPAEPAWRRAEPRWTPDPEPPPRSWEPPPDERPTPSWSPDPEPAWTPTADDAPPEAVRPEAGMPEAAEPDVATDEEAEPAPGTTDAAEGDAEPSETRSHWWRRDPAPSVLPWMPDTDPWASAAPTEDAPSEPEVVTDPPAGETQAPAAPASEDASAPRPVFDWLVEPEPEPDLEPEPEREPEPEPEPEPKPERQTEFEPEHELEPPPEPETEPDAVTAPEEPEAEVEPEPIAERPAIDMSWTPSRWGDPEPPVLSPWEPGVPTEAQAWPDEASAHGEPEPGAVDELGTVAPIPAPEPAWPSDDAAPSVESTQVLPTSWEPPAHASPSRSTGDLAPVAGQPRTRLVEPEIEADDDLEARPSTAEQAVPWLIGFILLLAGMVIVLLALIFAGEESFGAGASPSPSNVSVVVVTGSAEPSATPAPPTPRATAVATPQPTPTPIALPEYGPLEMVFQGRAAALAPIYLLRHDFTVEEEPATMAQDPAYDVRRFAWAPDGTLGAGLLADVLVSIEPGVEKRRLGDEIMTITFGRDGSTVYAVRLTQDGGNDVANVLAIDFASGDTTELASISYPRPTIGAEADLREAQFADDGGAVRLYWMEDEVLRLWALGAGNWTIDPADGAVEELEDTGVPDLWSPRAERQVIVDAREGSSTLTLVDEDGETVATTTAPGLVSHLRWSPDGGRVAFTVGRSASGGGVLQDLFLWDLGDGDAPTQLTNTGAAFGAEWLGSISRWRD